MDNPLGARVAVTANDGTYLGLGTFIGTVAHIDDLGPLFPDILLDTGVSILGNQCTWTPTKEHYPLPRIRHTLHRKHLLLVRNGEGVVWSGSSVPAETPIEITSFFVSFLEGEGEVVVAPYQRDGAEFFFLVRNIDFPTYGDA